MGWSMDRVHGVVHGPDPSGGPWTPVHVLYTSIFPGSRPLHLPPKMMIEDLKTQKKTTSKQESDDPKHEDEDT